MKYVVISNRLPITVTTRNGEIGYTRSGGGLATGLDSLESEVPKHWIGWCGVHVDEAEARESIIARLGENRLHPVFLTEKQIKDYYEGYSNSTIWPLCHYFYDKIVFDREFLDAYREVNRLFCQEAAKVVRPGDVVWVNDYQLMLLPEMLRQEFPDIGIGYFHHIPFPSYELFRCLPERAEILRGLLGADVVGFHTSDYMRHFISAVYRVLGLECRVDEITLADRVAETEAFPMGINFRLYHDAVLKEPVRKQVEEIRTIANGMKIILSVDRLDYSKGILNRLASFTAFLDTHPEYRGRVTLVMIVVPSRDTVEMYSALKEAIDKEVGDINGKYGHIGWVPVHYYYRSFSFDELAALYHLSDVALVTPLRDGMNLVAKEYVAAKRDQPGVLILSEMAGAARELGEAIIVNPTDIRQIADALATALSMDPEGQCAVLAHMQRHLEEHDVKSWASGFMQHVAGAKARNDGLRQKLLDRGTLVGLQARYRMASSRLLVFDYDGTLVPLVSDPSRANPPQSVTAVLDLLASDPANRVVICSGRDQDTLSEWIPNPIITLSAEHGAFYRENGVWHGHDTCACLPEEINRIVKLVHLHTPGSHIERKRTSLVWHYRNVDAWLAEMRAAQLINALMRPCSMAGLHVMRGEKIVEIKTSAFDKGQEMARLLGGDRYDFVLAMGDDVTDEDMFNALDADAVTVKVGRFSDSATYVIPNQEGVLPFLESLLGTPSLTMVERKVNEPALENISR